MLMSTQLFFDGQFLRSDKLLLGAGNRGLRYGDGVFETIKINQGVVQLGSLHMQRLFAALQLLEFEPPGYFTPGYLLEKITELAKKNGHANLGRIRVMIFRGNGGLYDAENHYPHHIIQSWALPPANHEWNENGLVLGLHRKAQKSADALANCKTNNYLPYVLGALEAKRLHWNDALLFNSKGNLCDSTIANIFLLKDDKIFTPALTEGPVAGIMRQYLLQQLPARGYVVQEAAITEDMLFAADEIFLSNAVYGLRWAGIIGNTKFSHQKTAAIYREIIQPLFLLPGK
jgi:branched-chain amino acid aminotransferase